MIRSQVSPEDKGFLQEIRAPVPLMFFVSPSTSPRELLIVTEYAMLNLCRPRRSWLWVSTFLTGPSYSTSTGYLTIMPAAGWPFRADPASRREVECTASEFRAGEGRRTLAHKGLVETRPPVPPCPRMSFAGEI